MLGYKVKGKNDIDNIQKCYFENRNVDMKTYVNLTDDCLIPYENLDNIDKAVKMFLRHIDNNSKIVIVVDPDADGYTSAAMIYSYICKLCPFADVSYLFHNGKQHGLSEDIVIPKDTNLVILPDGGTNDTEQCKALSEKEIDVLILDHHKKDKENPYAVIVNNQICDYDNKELCGAGIVYKFLQAVDEETWNDYANDYLDLVALANISDVMDIRSYETKRLIDKGLSQIKNKLFNGFITSQDYSIKGHININAVAFYVTPLINAMCRCGDDAEKELMFKGFIESDEIFKYKKRGASEEIDESIYDRVPRLCKNAKSRQDKIVQKNLPELKDDIESNHKNDDPIIFVKATEDMGSTFTGLVAMKIADFYKKPCLILRKRGNTYGGSARSYDNCPLESLKATLTNTSYFEYCQGHDNAFGFEIKPENVSNAIKKCKNDLKDVDFSEIAVDFEIDYDDFGIHIIKDIDNLKDYYGTGLKSPLIVIKNIELIQTQGVIMGKVSDTWKFITDDNIAFIKFKCDSGDQVLNYVDNDFADDSIFIDAICKVSFNDYNGIVTPQVEILKYEVI